MATEPLTTIRLNEAIGRARASAAGNLWETLLQLTGANASQLQEALATQHGISVVGESEIDAASVQPAKERGGGHVLGFWLNVAGRPHLVCGDPWSSEAIVHASHRPRAVLALALPGQLEEWKRSLLGQPASARDGGDGRQQESEAVKSPVVAFVDASITRAYDSGASDIHFEADRRGVLVKYRIDGVMGAGERLDDVRRAEEVISRIKVMAQLDITERRRPQDGRIRWERTGQEAVDLRVSIMPSIFGEDAVLRLLDRAQLRHAEETISLPSLGFSTELARRIRQLAGRPHGLLLVTGPTGSGKTTTVYAALSEVNNGLEKIITIEDPVEYELPGVLQIPVNEQKGLTFATGLRSILRHDPDKILVGEIRDAETAEIAVQSSLTGHLVMTTVHANSLFDVLGRFQHFGIEPFGLASALNGVVVQRLLRRTCRQCMQWRAPSADEAELLERHGFAPAANVPVPVGCEHCRHTGYKGRLVVAEVHELGDLHRDLIVRRASLLEMRQAMYPIAASSLLGQALHEAIVGATTLEEIRRVVG